MIISRRFLSKFEYLFAIFGISFFLGVWSFQSFFTPSEGSTESFFDNGFLNPILSLIQHSMFLATVALMLLNWKKIVLFIFSRKVACTLFAFLCISFLWSEIPHRTMMRSVSLLETITFGVYFGSCFSLYQQIRILQISFAMAAGLSLVTSVAIPVAGVEAGFHSGAWRGIFAHKNYLAREMALGALIARMSTPITPSDRQISTFLLITAILLVLMSGSVTGLLILFVALVAAEIFKTLRLELGLVLITWITSIFLLSVSGSVIAANFETIVVSLGRDPTLSSRTIIWGALIDKIHLRPWLGYGYEGFWRGMDGESAIIAKIIRNYVPPHAHNGLFDLTVAFGLIGLVLFLINLLSLLRRSILLARNTEIQEGLWPLSYTLFVLLYNQTESTLVEHNSIFWVLMVAAIASNLRVFLHHEKDIKETLERTKIFKRRLISKIATENSSDF